MFEYRVTKYDPVLRDASGAYTADEWTSVADIGRTFGDVALTDAEYHRAEDAYVNSALAFLREGGVASLKIEGLENHKQLLLKVSEGAIVSREDIGDLIRQILREEYWCRLEATGGFVHIGWDFYMYIGVPHRCPAAEELAKKLGLYAEEFASPYHDAQR